MPEVMVGHCAAGEWFCRRIRAFCQRRGFSPGDVVLACHYCAAAHIHYTVRVVMG